MRAAGALGGGGGWRWTPRAQVVLDGVCVPGWAPHPLRNTNNLLVQKIGQATPHRLTQVCRMAQERAWQA